MERHLNLMFLVFVSLFKTYLFKVHKIFFRLGSIRFSQRVKMLKFICQNFSCLIKGVIITSEF